MEKDAGRDCTDRAQGINLGDTASNVQPMNQKSDGIALGRAATHDWSPPAVARLRIAESLRAEAEVKGSNLIFSTPSKLEPPVCTMANSHMY